MRSVKNRELFGPEKDKKVLSAKLNIGINALRVYLMTLCNDSGLKALKMDKLSIKRNV